MTDTIEGAIRGAAAAIDHLVRTLVRDELRKHLGPEADHLLNVKAAPMKATKLRRLVRSGELRGYRHGRDMFVKASDLRAFIEGRPVQPPRRIAVPDPPADENQDGVDDVFVELGLEAVDPGERRAFYARLAQRRAEGGERGDALRHAEEAHLRGRERAKQREARAAKRAAKKRSGSGI